MKLSVIIINYNVKYYIDQCLRSVLKAIDVVDVERKGNQVEIIVVDNHSADGSVEYLEKRYPKNLYPMLKIVGSVHNLGSPVPTTLPFVRARASMFSC